MTNQLVELLVCVCVCVCVCYNRFKLVYWKLTFTGLNLIWCRDRKPDRNHGFADASSGIQTFQSCHPVNYNIKRVAALGDVNGTFSLMRTVGHLTSSTAHVRVWWMTRTIPVLSAAIVCSQRLHLQGSRSSIAVLIRQPPGDDTSDDIDRDSHSVTFLGLKCQSLEFRWWLYFNSFRSKHFSVLLF